MASADADSGDFNLVHPDHYAAHRYPHEQWKWMRARHGAV
jgi:hypothetical protein